MPGLGCLQPVDVVNSVCARVCLCVHVWKCVSLCVCVRMSPCAYDVCAFVCEPACASLHACV